MKQAIFADTYYYLALLSPRDFAHLRAVSISKNRTGRIVTTAWIVQELADGLSAPPARNGFLQFWAALQNDPQTLIVDPEISLWRRGLELYTSRPDQGWSLTDCLSFVIMREHAISEALTADRHFEQAGFTALLRA